MYRTFRAVTHLENEELPDLTLSAADGSPVDLHRLDGRLVMYVHPMIGRPGMSMPDGWDVIPGLRGCTAQSCSFRDHYAELRARNTFVYGLSTQSTAAQQEARDRLHLPFELLSDPSLTLKQALGMPTVVVDGVEVYRRLTMVIDEGRIVKVFYPIDVPEHNPMEVLSWLDARSTHQTKPMTQ